MDLDGAFVTGACVALTLLLAGWELKSTLDAAAPRPRARPSPDWRCPFCHEAFEAAPGERVRCRACGTRHHATCWLEHRGCSVHGCGTVDPAGREAAPWVEPAPEPAPVAQPAAPDEAPVAVPAAVAAAPAG
ncbi:MAG: hypothetical protein M9894_24800 [Planctomycetes bacterium]|nr:hypothetical protein [Planctomycetota bacterium]